MSRHRLYGLYDHSTERERIDGLFWYDNAREHVEHRSTLYGLPTQTVAGILAALSPNTTWDNNLKDLDAMLGISALVGTGPELEAEVVVTTYRANRAKALRILRGESPEGVLTGPRAFKVPIFYRNIIGDWSVPCIDSHAINAWFGYRRTGGKLSAVPVRTLRRITHDYTVASHKKGLTPAEFQAIIWVSWQRRIRAGRVKGYRK